MRVIKDWNNIFIRIALLVSEKSTCGKVKVGAIIVKGNRIISMGYNGVPSGQKHCEDIFLELKIKEHYPISFLEFMKREDIKEKHRLFQLSNEIHAEMNAISFAAKNGVSTNDTNIYTTWSPCTDCAKAILQAGIKEVYYLNEYKTENLDGRPFLIKNKIKCIKVDVKGEGSCY